MNWFKNALIGVEPGENSHGDLTEFENLDLTEAEVEDLHHKTAMNEVRNLKSLISHQIDRKKYYGDSVSLDQLEYVEKELGRILKTYP